MPQQHSFERTAQPHSTWDQLHAGLPHRRSLTPAVPLKGSYQLAALAHPMLPAEKGSSMLCALAGTSERQENWHSG